jgi:hypothetical protein
MDEPEVVRRVHRHRIQHGIDGAGLSRLFTDPHPTLIGYHDLKPFQRFSIGEPGSVVHPDLLGQESDSESLFAIEAKGGRDLLWGLAQAESYQDGVQRSFLAAPMDALGENFVLKAREKGVGVIAVDDTVRFLHVPLSRRPLNTLYRGLIHAVGTAAWITEGGTFAYNLPTHYLVWTALLAPGHECELREIASRFADYPMPSQWRSALQGARKLGLVAVHGPQVRLTDVGATIRRLLPYDSAGWAAIHRDIRQPASDMTLMKRCPQAALVLRLLLLRDPVVRLVMDGLRRLPDSGGNFVDLAKACAGVDRRSSVIFFMKPEATPLWVAKDGSVEWGAVPSDCFRSTSFFQYKSVLKHAGLIRPERLGASTVNDYRPERDLWHLHAELDSGDAASSVPFMHD